MIVLVLLQFLLPLLGSQRSNEYETFMHYLSNEVNYVNETEWVDNCNSLSILADRDNGSTLASCADEALSYFNQRYHSILTPILKSDQTSGKTYGSPIVDCHYDVIDLGHFTVNKLHLSDDTQATRSSISTSKLYLDIEFEIHQSDSQSVRHMVHGSSQIY